MLSEVKFQKWFHQFARIDQETVYYMGAAQKIVRELRNGLDTEKKRATVFLLGILCCYLSM